MDGVRCYVTHMDGMRYAFLKVPVLPRVGEYVITSDDKTWEVAQIWHVWGVQGYEHAELRCNETVSTTRPPAPPK